MCQDCGCSVVGEIGIHDHHHEGDEHHHHPHPHDHSEKGGNAHRSVEIPQSILLKNDRLAERNRGYFRAKNLLVLNLVSSPRRTDAQMSGYYGHCSLLIRKF